MIERIEFQNFKVLHHTALPLGRLTLIIGPNGSGKSTALQALKLMKSPEDVRHEQVASTGDGGEATVTVEWSADHSGTRRLTKTIWHAAGNEKDVSKGHFNRNDMSPAVETGEMEGRLSAIRVYALDPEKIKEPVQLAPKIELSCNGFGLAGVLDRLRDGHPERFEDLNQELNRWLPEFDRILFHVPKDGFRKFSLRTIAGHEIPADALSDGTLLALAILTIAYVPDHPPLIAFEDPDRGLHPRLLRDVQEALYRLAYPENFGEDRDPVQVVATTHSPYFLDLFKDHPEEIVIAQRRNGEAVFERLSDVPDIDEILADAPLGEVWYSGILGGVPLAP